jgi:hypothetical protein
MLQYFVSIYFPDDFDPSIGGIVIFEVCPG